MAKETKGVGTQVGIEKIVPEGLTFKQIQELAKANNEARIKELEEQNKE